MESFWLLVDDILTSRPCPCGSHLVHAPVECFAPCPFIWDGTVCNASFLVRTSILQSGMTDSDTATAAIMSAVLFLSALYTFIIIARLPPGWLRLLGSLPVFAINFYLPHAVDATQNAVMSIILTTFFGWWANFKVGTRQAMMFVMQKLVKCKMHYKNRTSQYERLLLNCVTGSTQEFLCLLSNKSVREWIRNFATCDCAK